MIDAEVIYIASTILKELLGKESKTELQINSLGDREDRESYNEALIKYYTPHID